MLKVFSAVSKGIITACQGPKTKIQNKSDVPIFLIAIHCPKFLEARSKGIIEVRMSKIILPNDHLEVGCSDFDISGANFSQIYIIFRAGNSNDLNILRKKGKDLLLQENLKKYSNGIKVENEEDLILPSYLIGKPQLCLTCDEKGATSEVPTDIHVAVAVEVASNLEDPESKKKDLQAKIASRKNEKKHLEAGINKLEREIKELEKEIKELDKKPNVPGDGRATLNSGPSSTTNKISTRK